MVTTAMIVRRHDARVHMSSLEQIATLEVHICCLCIGSCRRDRVPTPVQGRIQTDRCSDNRSEINPNFRNLTASCCGEPRTRSPILLYDCCHELEQLPGHSQAPQKFSSIYWLPFPMNTPVLTKTTRWLLQGKHAEAKALYLRAIGIEEKVLGPNHPRVATTIKNLAGLLCKQVIHVYSHGMRLFCHV